MIRSVQKFFFNRSSRRATIAIIVFLLFWETCSRSLGWFGFQVPWIGKIPAPSAVLTAWIPLLTDAGYWTSWYLSAKRVFTGFLVAMILGIPFGLLLAINRTAYGIMFPTFEVLRPIPPLAWGLDALCCWLPCGSVRQVWRRHPPRFTAAAMPTPINRWPARTVLAWAPRQSP